VKSSTRDILGQVRSRVAWLDLERLQLGPTVYTANEGEHVAGKVLMRA
jgi:hypothetical protein